MMGDYVNQSNLDLLHVDISYIVTGKTSPLLNHDFSAIMRSGFASINLFFVQPSCRSLIRLTPLCILLLVGACSSNLESDPNIRARLPERVDYNFHVQPLLSDRCYACHGPDDNAREADLHLYTEEGALVAKAAIWWICDCAEEAWPQ